MADEAERRTRGYGPGFAPMVAAAEPLAAQIVDSVRVNTPDQTGRGIEAITAANIAVFACQAVEVERQRIEELIRGYSPDTVYLSDEDGNEYPETVVWEQIREALLRRIQEGPAR